ncbi:hypothetical protein DT070_04040 [Polaromonas sp. SP1]|nr:hypothetical protein DT070_04040 [Polaromonas sp. SP1]
MPGLPARGDKHQQPRRRLVNARFWHVLCVVPIVTTIHDGRFQMLVFILRPLAWVGLATAFATTGLHASDAAGDRPAPAASQTQTPRVPAPKAKPAKTRPMAKRTVGTNPAMPLWEGPWGPHH